MYRPTYHKGDSPRVLKIPRRITLLFLGILTQQSLASTCMPEEASICIGPQKNRQIISFTDNQITVMSLIRFSVEEPNRLVISFCF